MKGDVKFGSRCLAYLEGEVSLGRLLRSVLFAFFLAELRSGRGGLCCFFYFVRCRLAESGLMTAWPGFGRPYYLQLW